ncbi:rod shape-determining protein RodA [Anaerostipes sp. 494a]|uniref:FtsW/RodA/SpoVE family cell cycle protein n=1 Tax=unclassified Anaerostipes TaxID=2635253 RepID=UPI0009530ADA|nr:MULTISPECIES: FtsW/RodA/SpoVE family cell cycle protein [unclassified Anaerostipes]MCI5622481.1 rod shape-determining protein RodA [Anaerostipes sp.]MDY2726956.1 FtsW/RodA/SpoVE family cell cycle protein [Anaerostipes faecalis]OLR58805.1 rod shape-determining protein RodA [Anaerostipes sp. 494a]
MFRNYRLKNYNFKLILTVLVLSAMGLVFIHSANPSFVVKQALGIVMGIIVIVAVSMIDFQFFTRNSELLYILNLVLLLGVKFFGKEVNNAKRWFSLGPLGTFQPSELTKIIMIIVVAVYLVKHQYDLNEPKVLGKLALLCAPPLYLILSQPNLSTTLDICFIIIAMVFVAGLDSKLIIRVLAIGIPLLAIFLWYVQTPGQILLRPHQVERIVSFLHPEDYADSTALQTSNSVMAIGSGGLFGKGFGSSTISNVSASDVNLVSEQQTDFIFSAVGEEFGFVGCIVVMAVLFILVLQCIGIARKADNLIGMYVATGVASYMGFQSFINIGVATGTLPNTGLPLPFISYGLSSILSASIGIGLLLNIHLQGKRY